MPQKLLRLPRWLSGKEPACQCRGRGFNPWFGKIPWRRKWQPTPGFLPGKFRGQRILVGYSLWRGSKESDTTEHACMHHLLAICDGLAARNHGGLGNHNLSMYPEMKEGLETVNIHHFGLPSSHHWVRKIILFRSRKTHCVLLKEDNQKVLTS